MILQQVSPPRSVITLRCMRRRASAKSKIGVVGKSWGSQATFRITLDCERGSIGNGEQGSSRDHHADGKHSVKASKRGCPHCPWCRRSTEKCIFMDKRVREISRFFVAPRREFAPAVWRVSRTLLSRNTSTSVQTAVQTSHYHICVKYTHAPSTC